MNKYPIYIVSKGRADSRLTSRALEKMNVDYKIVVEEQEYSIYAKVIDKDKILILPEKYLDEYDTCDDLGRTKSVGPGAARNYCWDHSIEQGHSSHWVLDDNIHVFYRWHNNLKVRVYSGVFFRVMEDFVDRYENIAIAGPQYEHFTPRREKRPPFSMNTRIYSCLLIRNDIPFRWRGRYNEDTDLSLRVLKKGWCTVQFNAFLQDKAPTQTVKGGNDKDFYSKEGTLPKSKMQVKLHPDVSRIVWKFNRWHHTVDYSKFRKNTLIKKKDLIIPDRINEYGMKLVSKNV